MSRRLKAISAIAALTFIGSSLAACGSGNSADKQSDNAATEERETQTITMAGWGLNSGVEFQTIAEGFNDSQDKYKVEIKEYDSSDYDTQLTADLSAGNAPDILPMKNMNMLYAYQSQGALRDITEVASALTETPKGIEDLVIDGSTYGIPYRMDAWVLFYNKDLFDKAGIAYPDGCWTWDEYVKVAKELNEKLPDSKGSYMHNWGDLTQGLATAQSPNADYLSGDYSYMVPFYERAIDLQDSGAQESFATIVTSQLGYASEFGKQKAAMVPMGSWLVGALINQQASGEADKFTWGIAPMPQVDSSTTCSDKVPNTLGTPTGMSVNASAPDSKTDAIDAFLTYIGSEDLALALAAAGNPPAHSNDEVTDALFAIPGMPQDDLSKFALSTYTFKLATPPSEKTAEIENILKDVNSEVMTESVTPQKGLEQATSEMKSQGLI